MGRGQTKGGVGECLVLRVRKAKTARAPLQIMRGLREEMPGELLARMQPVLLRQEQRLLRPAGLPAHHPVQVDLPHSLQAQAPTLLAPE